MIKKIIKIILILILLILILGLPLMLLWNWLMPFLFNLPKITFWQAIGINILISIIFKMGFYKKENN